MGQNKERHKCRAEDRVKWREGVGGEKWTAKSERGEEADGARKVRK